MPSTNMTETAPKKDPPTGRRWMLWAGWFLFALGTVGIFLPILPTTIFWICAVWFWSRSSPHLSERILGHPRFGPQVKRFIERGEMTRQGKLAATSGIALGFLLLQLVTRPSWGLGLSVGLILTAVTIWLWFRPEPDGNAQQD